MVEAPAEGDYDAIILAVAHLAFLDQGLAGIRRYGRPGAILYDVKSVLQKSGVDGRL